MRNFQFIRIILLVVLVLLVLIELPPLVSRSAELATSPVSPVALVPNADEQAVTNAGQDNNSTYYTIRRDVRRCASPMCGGFFIKRVNHPRTRCANGRNMAECYVAEINWNGQSQVDSGHALVRGKLSQRRYQRLGRFGVLSVTESWRAMSEQPAEGTFFRVKDLGIRCITYPCLTHQEARLNSYGRRKVAGVELDGAHAPSESVAEAGRAMTTPDGILVAGNHARVVGPAGRANTLKATQFYLRGSGPIAAKPCIKTGCSSQICADQDVISTCEWRSEYECYRRALCERQANGQCGFTQTSELTACLRGNR